MKITIEGDDGTTTVHQDVTDYYLAVRHLTPMGSRELELAVLPETRSYSHGNNLRELAKELYQSWVEIQSVLGDLRRK